MKTYFDYEGRISSKDLAEAIAYPAGLGPFMGFGSATVTNNKLTIHSRTDTTQNTLNPSPYFKDINDRIVARKIAMDEGSNTIPLHGLITRTGHIFVSTQSDIVITPRGSKGSFNEVLVFAIYENVEQPIKNVPTFVAYWNGSSQSFYEYWKKSMDSNYGSSNKNISLEVNPWDTSISYEDLISKVSSSVPLDYQASKTAIFIGAYGTGINVETNNEEQFALVPYGGVYPQSVPFTPDYYFKLKRVLEHVQNFTLQGLDGYDSLKAYIDYRFGLLNPNQDQPGDIPVGGIILWYGSDIPNNYHICDGTNGTPNLTGLFVRAAGADIALGSTGGSEGYSMVSANLPKHAHSGVPSLYVHKADDGSNNTDNGAFFYDKNDQGGYGAWTGNTGRENPDPIPTIPPYFALYYIMRIS